MWVIPTKSALRDVSDNVGQTYEGGLGSVPNAEAHGSYTFCALACLCLLGDPKDTFHRSAFPHPVLSLRSDKWQISGRAQPGLLAVCPPAGPRWRPRWTVQQARRWLLQPLDRRMLRLGRSGHSRRLLRTRVEPQRPRPIHPVLRSRGQGRTSG